MVLSPTRHRFTVKSYHLMAEADIFGPDDRVELVDGQVVDMSPIGPRHSACVDRLNRFLLPAVGARAIVRVQGPMQVGEFSEPQPDLLLLRDRANFYADHHPAPPDILLAVEVADTSLRFDLERKAPLYLAGGIPEVWVVDLVAGVVHVTTASGGRQAGVGDSVAPEAFPDVVLPVTAILG